ncbi:enoyl-CoA hydratase-related protein [Streptomyces sp. AK02-04a]|uniref:enoyl-CoA hydratase-related protein n=1 Tax=Streptomyces sp. AK02-04a TaxID=3028649 RepID=UPI0029BF8EB5|nr:enoyl-CoA hydratase-related protein [Streptomyces sp. AK02-04a]MDX3763522.1 enoyl-CoA hydratase-related protein [Streptomyces sp. AK02-04a]
MAAYPPTLSARAGTPVQYHRERGVAVITLAAAASGNRLTEDLVSGFADALDTARADPDIRACVIQGTPTVFCAGAAQEQMTKGWTSQLDSFMRAPLRFPLPVVASVRGHAVGGGLLFALACDVVVLGTRAVLSANFLRYGFTPCGGATHLVPLKLGAVLGQELLLTAHGYTSAELRDRGCPLRVVDDTKVDDTALRTALLISDTPRNVLELLKTRLAEPVLAATDKAIQAELPGHRATVGTEESLARIGRRYPTTRPGEPAHQ